MPSESRTKPRKCPLCGKPRDEAYKPFCGRGCRDRDLNRWFDEDYRVPAEQAPDGTMETDRYDED